ncbi:hypothetical protein Smic_32970 [Streptomyces microflavus]|uniref:Uncharacterized protein n=1 Tax=Streptomyces microflavus TaxID=1919 RepID=A0A7J0CQG5_STRMI|nr:hypothetical protein Smic_32970 [Streptomyces microflavus]
MWTSPTTGSGKRRAVISRMVRGKARTWGYVSGSGPDADADPDPGPDSGAGKPQILRYAARGPGAAGVAGRVRRSVGRVAPGRPGCLNGEVTAPRTREALREVTALTPQQALAADPQHLAVDGGGVGLGEPGDGFGHIDRKAALGEGVHAAARLADEERYGGRHLRLDEAGRDRVDGDAVVGGGARPERADEPDDPGLAGGVVGLPGVARDARDGGRGDDPAAARDDARLEQLVGGAEHAVQVDLDHRCPAVGGHVGEAAVAGDARVVDEDAEPVGRRCGDAVGGVGCGDVQGEGGGAEPVGGAFQLFPRPRHVQGDDPGPVAGEHRGDGRADAPGGPGDQGGAAGERGGRVGGGAGAGGGGGGGELDDLAADVGGPGESRKRSVDSAA